MGLERRLRRQQKHGNGHTNGLSDSLGQLQKALGDLQGVRELGQASQGVQEVVAELTELRDQLKTALAAVPDYQAELERQRAVFLRLLFYPDVLVTPGTAGTEALLAAEQRYRAEYDAMMVLVKLLSWVKEAP